jgi:hypothetical protein
MHFTICADFDAIEGIANFILPNTLGIIANSKSFGWLGILGQIRRNNRRIFQN